MTDRSYSAIRQLKYQRQTLPYAVIYKINCWLIWCEPILSEEKTQRSGFQICRLRSHKLPVQPSQNHWAGSNYNPGTMVRKWILCVLEEQNTQCVITTLEQADRVECDWDEARADWKLNAKCIQSCSFVGLDISITLFFHCMFTKWILCCVAQKLHFPGWTWTTNLSVNSKGGVAYTGSDII